MRHTVRTRTAPIWPVLRLFLAAALFLCLIPAARAKTNARKLAAAKAQFERAERQRATLQAKPQKERTADEYFQLITTYRRVYLVTARAAESQSAYAAIAELYGEMGRQFDAKYYQSAIDAYLLLLHEYPNTHYRDDVLITIGKIEKDDLRRTDFAEKTFQEFLRRHPHSPRAREAQQALNEIGAERRQPSKPVSARKLAPESEPHHGIPEVTQIRTWNAENYTRIVIDLDNEVKFQAARISDPDRIYFDIHEAKLSATLAGRTHEVQSGFLRAIRVAQNQTGVVRVVLEVSKVTDYSAYLLPNPYRLVVDVYGSPPLTAKTEAAASAEPERTASLAYKREKTAPARTEKVAAPPPTSKSDLPTTPTPGRGTEPSAQPERAAATPPENLPMPTAETESPRAQPPRGEPPKPLSAASARLPRGKSLREAVTPLVPPAVPHPTHDGQHSLTRALGLKIGRIVIDAGHGGGDTGTIGPTGLMEKDLCLDVALRLGKIIQQRLPGAEVVYTRQSDSFVPLEERTAIANQARADLFISIHANSSPDHKTRGVETYYLNFSASPEAMAVASRENSLAQGSIHDLQDIVKKIARNEKLEESRELATDIQVALTNRLQRINRTLKSRGVRKAPFVVLIGANMPSVLSEVSFLSNPADEQMLKKAEHRQRVAEGLYYGVESYLQSINSLTYNHPKPPLGARSPALGNTGNQR